MITKEEFYDLVANPDKQINNDFEGLKDLLDVYPFFQMAWMLFLKRLKNMERQDFQYLLNKGALRVPDRKQLYYFVNNKSISVPQEDLFEPPKTELFEYDLDETENKEHSDSLIDKFLSSGPSAIKIKNEITEENDNNSDNELVEKSVDENDEIITETLAMIYFEQKKYDKALNAFKKLSLKYPEKSIYFATRIAEIEQLKNI